MTKELLDTDGENRAVRSFLMAYGSGCHKIGDMKSHMELSGWKDHPDFVAFKSLHNAHLTKAEAQDWLRHLFAMESHHQAQVMAPIRAGEAAVCKAFGAWAETQGNGEISMLDVLSPSELEDALDKWKLDLLDVQSLVAALRAAYRPLALDQEWTEHHSRSYPQKAATIINAARGLVNGAGAFPPSEQEGAK